MADEKIAFKMTLNWDRRRNTGAGTMNLARTGGR